jgi:hypothetical protein
MPSALSMVDDTSFNRLVLQSPIPTVVVCLTAESEYARYATSNCAMLAQRYQQHLRVVVLLIDECPLICTSFGIQVSATYMLFRAGEPCLATIGCLPLPLLERFFDMAATQERPYAAVWYPQEQVIEDLLILPLLKRWGWQAQRQVPCKVLSAGKTRRGIIDILVAPDQHAAPVALFENKRMIASQSELEQASMQAQGYAQALALGIFVIADAIHLWIFQRNNGRVSMAAEISWYQLEPAPEQLCELLVALAHSEPG